MAKQASGLISFRAKAYEFVTGWISYKNLSARGCVPTQSVCKRSNRSGSWNQVCRFRQSGRLLRTSPRRKCEWRASARRAAQCALSISRRSATGSCRTLELRQSRNLFWPVDSGEPSSRFPSTSAQKQYGLRFLPRPPRRQGPCRAAGPPSVVAFHPIDRTTAPFLS